MQRTIQTEQRPSYWILWWRTTDQLSGNDKLDEVCP